MPRVSVIVPCYKQAQYLPEALDSVLAQTYSHWECIIINDGSTDNTEEIAQQYCEKDKRIKYIYKENEGLSSARNTGIKNSVGVYILPLDADDKIANTYLEKSVKILDEDQKIGILYSEAELFGEQFGKWDIPGFNFSEFLNDNQIFCSAFFRREDYDKTNGYNSNMIYGLEDWDFWLSLIEKEVEVYKIPETLFYYRIRNNSMVREMDFDKKKYLQNIIVRNHPILYANRYYNPIHLYTENVEIKSKLASVSHQLETIKKSKAYKLSLILAAPVRFTKAIFRQL